MDLSSISLIRTLVFVFLGALTGGVLAHRLKLPTIIGYILCGFIIGNTIPGLLDIPFLTLIGDVGVTLLLFTLGVEFSFHKLRDLIRSIFWAVLIQVGLLLLIVLGALLIAGFEPIVAIFIAIVASFSSTAIIVKVLSERGELETVPGELVTGWTIIQDLTVIPVMLTLPVIVSFYLSKESSPSFLLPLSINLVKSVIAILVIFFLGRTGIPALLSAVARLGIREVFLIATVGIVFLSAIGFTALGLSPGLGAFIAGLLMAETSQNHAIFSEVRPLRDTFAVVFFVTIGMMLPLTSVLRILPMTAGILVLIFVIKTIIVFALTRILGYHRKTAFIAAVTLLPLSEFGFLIAKEGVSIGALDTQSYLFIVTLTFLSMILGAPLLSKVHGLYYGINNRIFKKFPKTFLQREEKNIFNAELPVRDHVVLCGYGRVGRYVGRALEMAGVPFLVVEYNATIVKMLKDKNIRVIYGDPADREVLDYAQVDFARAVVIAIPDRHTQELVIGNVLTLNKHVRIICRTHREEDQQILKLLGVTTVVQPEFEAAVTISERLLSEYGVSSPDIEGKIHRLKIEHGMT